MVLSTSSPISGDATELFVFSDAGSKIILPSAALLFKGDYERDGPDLLVSMEGEQTVRVVDYFTHADLPALYAADGTSLKGSIVESLAGPLAPGQYAQSGASATAGAIGQVEELSGTATVQRADGTTETLQVGTKVFQNDVVQTADGSKVSLTFVDGTIFTLASASRMILDELIYDPNSSENSGIFNLVEGSFVFIAGQAAKTGGLEINTPAATMGIRGTTVRVDIITVDGKTTVEVSLNRDPNGETGIFTLSDLNGNEIATIDSTDSKWIISPVEGETREVDRSSTDLDSDQVLITDAVNAFQSATQRVQQGGNFVENNGPTEQQDGNEGEQEAAPEDSGQEAAPDDGGASDDAPLDTQQESGSEEQDQSQLDSSGIETDLASFDDGNLDSSVDIPDLESGDVEVEGIDGGPSEAGPSGLLPEENQDAGADSDIETGELPSEIVDDSLAINLPTLTTSVAEDGSIGITGFSINGPSGGTAVVTLVAGSTVTLAPGSGVTILTGTGTNDVTVEIQGTFAQLNAALNGDGTGPSLVYAPSPDEDDFGTLDITVEFDGEAVSSQLVIDIIPQQDVPTAVDDTLDIGEDAGAASGNLLDNDTDPDTTPTPDTLSVVEAFDAGTLIPFGVATTLAGGGSLVVNANGAYSFDAGSDFNDLAAGDTATQTVNYQITDGNGNFDDAVLTITVTGADDAPTISVANFTAVAEGDTGTVTIESFQPSIVLTGSDPDAGETPTVVNGSLSLAVAAGSDIATTVDFMVNAADVQVDTAAFDSLAAGEQGLFELTFDVASGPVTSMQTALITIDGVNDAPVASAQAVTTDEDMSVMGQLVATDIDGDALTFSAVGTPANGSVVVNPDGSFTYTPDADFNGTGGFDFIVDDGTGGTATETVTVTINAVNDVPSNIDEDTALGTITEGTGLDESVTFLAVAFDDPDGDIPTFTLNPLSTNPMASFTINFTQDFMPDPSRSRIEIDATILNSDLDQLAQDETLSFDFTLTIDDGNGGVVTVGDAGSPFTLNVVGTNDAPTLVNAPLGFGFNEDEVSSVDLSAIVVGDVDSDVTLTLSVDQGTLTANGGVTGAAIVSQVNSTTVTVSGAPADVTTFLDAANAISYQGPLNLAGNNVATLTYSLSDGVAPAVTDTSNITLIAVNDDPTLTGLPTDVTVTDGTASNIDLSGFTLADVDSVDHIVTITVDMGVFTTVAAGGSDLTVNLSTANFQTISLTGAPAAINTYLSNPANITYTAPGGVTGDNQATITVFANDGDGSGAVQLGTVNIDIDAANASPTITSVPSDISVAEDTLTDINLSTVEFTDVDGDELTLTLSVDNGTFAAPTAAAATAAGFTASIDLLMSTITIVGAAAEIETFLDTTSNIQYQGAPNVNGDNAALLTLDVTDGISTAVSDTINIDIDGVNDAPVFDIGSTPSTLTVNEDTFTFLAGLNVSDVDAGEADVTVTLSSTNGFFTIDDTITDGLIASQITNNGTSTVTLVGSIDAISTTFALDAGVTGIRFQGNAGVSGTGSITFAVDDGGASGSGGAMSDSVTINTNILPPNEAPSLNLDGLTASELVTNGDFETTSFTNGSNLVSPGDGTIPGFTVVNAPSRVLVGTNLGGGSGNVAIGLGGNPTGGSASTIQTTIETIVGRTYEISLNTSDPANVTGNLAFAFVDTAAGENETLSNFGNPETFRFVADSTTTVVSIQAQFSTGNGLIVDNLSVTEVRPDNTFVAQEGASTSLEGIVIDDDSVSSANFSVTLTVASGTLSDTNGSSPVTITGSGTNTLVLTGTLADINSEIAGGFVTYDGAAGFRGLDTLTITANDGDTAGGGGAQSFTQTVDVVVGNADSIIVGTDLADNNIGTVEDDIIFSLDSTNGTDVGNFLNGNDVYIGGAGQEDVDGQDGDDFIFGAGGNDTLDGFTGNDTLLGGDGNDILMDRAGEVGTYDGGAGQDTFFVTNAGAIDLTAAGNGSFTSIETLNISNSEVNTLTLDETNIFNLSETSNITVEGLLGGASLPESILINAEAGDTVNFELADAGTFEYNIATPVGIFNIVELVELGSGLVRGTVAVSNTATLVVEGGNNAPAVTTDMVTTDFLEGDPPVVVNNTIEVTDADGDMITGATVSVALQSGVFQEGDILLFTDTASITGSYNDTTGVLTLNGTDTAANYQAALRSVQFRSFNQDLNDLLRDVDFVVNDGTDDSTVVTSIINPTSINNAPTIDTSGARGLEIVANGGFETPDIGVGSSTLSSGSAAITGFTVGDGANVTTATGNINLTSFLNAPEGDQVIDLDGETAGAITTTLTTEIGATYEVSFQYAGNPGSDNGVRSANVIVGGQSQTISFDTAPFNTGNLVYQTQTIVFTAIATTTGLTFESLSADGSDAGILIDDVSVREVGSTGVGVGLGGSFTFSDLVFADPDGDPNNAMVILTVTNGTLNLGAGSTVGITVGGDGTGTITLGGTLSTINAYFENDDALTYANTSGVDGDVDNLSISVNDGGSFGIGVAQSASTSIPITLGSNTIAGTSANNTLSGGAGADVIEGLAGNDVLNGLGGNDVLIGGDGNDTLNGGDGDDFLNAGSGADSLFGNDGNDTLQSLNAFGIDTILDGGAGDDRIFVDDFATNQIDGGAGRDELRYFQSGNIDLRSTGINIDGVEALSIENGETNTLFLDLARLQGLSSDSDTDLEALLDQALTAGRTILGDADDTVNVEVDTGFTFTENTALSTDLQDDNGNLLDVFEFVETSTGDVFATVAIEEQVNVVTS